VLTALPDARAACVAIAAIWPLGFHSGFFHSGKIGFSLAETV
jgi:hypothetical protein